jgi:hypothetical protein
MSSYCNCVALPTVGNKKRGTKWKCNICGSEWIIKNTKTGLNWTRR